MNKTEVFNLLKENQNERGIKNWYEMEAHKCQLKSFGLGLTVLRKLAKQVGKDHDLALQLWDSDCYDMKVMAVLIDDPKLITREQMELQVKEINYGLMVHVFSACGAPVAKTSFIDEVADSWVKSADPVKRRCAYGFVYELSKSKKKSAPDDNYFLNYIKHIDKTFNDEDKSVHLSMAGALMGIGKKNLQLNQAAIKVAKKIGPVPVETGKTQCEPMDITKTLTSDYLTKKFAS